VAPESLLGEHRAPVNFDLKHAARRLDQLDIGVRVGFPDLGRQTGGPRFVVSDHAVFDSDAHSR